jgi:hypothetical protein
VSVAEEVLVTVAVVVNDKALRPTPGAFVAVTVKVKSLSIIDGVGTPELRGFTPVVMAEVTSVAWK